MKFFPTKKIYLTTQLNIEDIVYRIVQRRLKSETYNAGDFLVVGNQIHFYSTFYYDTYNSYKGVNDSAPPDIQGVIVDKGKFRMLKLEHGLGDTQKSTYFSVSCLTLILWLLYAGGVWMRHEDFSNLLWPSLGLLAVIPLVWIIMCLHVLMIADKSMNFYKQTLDAQLYRLRFTEEYKRDKDPIK